MYKFVHYTNRKSKGPNFLSSTGNVHEAFFYLSRVNFPGVNICEIIFNQYFSLGMQNIWQGFGGGFCCLVCWFFFTFIVCVFDIWERATQIFCHGQQFWDMMGLLGVSAEPGSLPWSFWVPSSVGYSMILCYYFFLKKKQSNPKKFSLPKPLGCGSQTRVMVPCTKCQEKGKEGKVSCIPHFSKPKTKLCCEDPFSFCKTSLN